MSCAIVVQTKDNIFVGQDSALSSYKNGVLVRCGQNFEKTFVYNQEIYFISGTYQNSIFLRTYIKGGGNIEDILPFVRRNKWTQEILVVKKENDNIITYHYSHIDDFEPHIYIAKDNTLVYSVGIKTKDAIDIFLKEFKKIDIFNNYLNTFKQLSCEYVGGTLSVFGIKDGIFDKLYQEKIDDIENKKATMYNSKLVVADAIVGRIIAGDSLNISNEDNTFTVDGAGATMTNGQINIIKGINRIALNPSDGITIYKNNEKQMYINSQTGDLEIKGNITANSGSIGGWEIRNTGLYSPNGDYIASNGTGKLSLLTWTPTQATFNGNIYANNIGGSWSDWDSLKNKFISVDTIIADKASINQLNQVQAQINQLQADKASINQLNSATANIENLIANEISAVNARFNSISVGSLTFNTTKNMQRVTLIQSLRPLFNETKLVQDISSNGTPIYRTIRYLQGLGYTGKSYELVGYVTG